MRLSTMATNAAEEKQTENTEVTSTVTIENSNEETQIDNEIVQTDETAIRNASDIDETELDYIKHIANDQFSPSTPQKPQETLNDEDQAQLDAIKKMAGI